MIVETTAVALPVQPIKQSSPPVLWTSLPPTVPSLIWNSTTAAATPSGNAKRNSDSNPSSQVEGPSNPRTTDAYAEWLCSRSSRSRCPG